MPNFGLNPYSNPYAFGNNSGGFQTTPAFNGNAGGSGFNPAYGGMDNAGFNPAFFSGAYTNRAGNALNGELEEGSVDSKKVIECALRECFSVKPLEKPPKMHKPDDSGYYEALGLSEYG